MHENCFQVKYQKDDFFFHFRDDYEVSCRELDLLVEAALSCDGVYG
jgi:hypothetical protein